MSRRVPSNPERVFPENEVARLAGRRQYRQTVGPSWSDSEEEESPSQPSNHRPDHRLNEHGEPLSPPPPYSEQDHDLGGDQTWSHDRINLYPGEGGRAEYVTDSSGRRERYVVDGFGHRVPWPFVDRENSSYNGEEDPDMIYLESCLEASGTMNIVWDIPVRTRRTIENKIPLKAAVPQDLRQDVRGLAIGAQRMMTQMVRIRELAVVIEPDQDLVVGKVLQDVEDNSGVEAEKDQPMWTRGLEVIQIRITIKKCPLLVILTLSGRTKLKLVTIGYGDRQG